MVERQLCKLEVRGSNPLASKYFMQVSESRVVSHCHWNVIVPGARFEKSKSERVLGVGIVGHGAGELIAEGVVAVEMGATVRNLAESVHPHPTVSETIMEAAEVFFGNSSHAFVRKRTEQS